MRQRLLIVLLATSALVFGFSVDAYAHVETTDTVAAAKYAAKGCLGCHGADTVDVTASGVGRQGPHAGYTTTTKKCQACHEVHEAAPGGVNLLPKSTVKATCEVCHDGTGGKGVYGVLRKRGYVGPIADHSIEATAVIPGGDASTGGSTTYDWNGAAAGNGALTCTDCHSPHNARTVADFTGDRQRTATDTAGYVSNRLLRQQPTSASTAATVYGSDWCGGCHKGRLNSAGLHNHPVDYGAGAFYYDSVQRLTAVNVTSTAAGTLGRSNFGYVMPYPRSAGQAGHEPICQQCHEDARSVGDVVIGRVAASEAFSVTTTDGLAPTDNPRYQTFPHETTNTAMLVETDDDLCTNCHDPSVQLP